MEFGVMIVIGLSIPEFLSLRQLLIVNRQPYTMGWNGDDGYWLEAPGFPQREVDLFLVAVRGQIN
jgi:hypothetical protein